MPSPNTARAGLLATFALCATTNTVIAGPVWNGSPNHHTHKHIAMTLPQMQHRCATEGKQFISSFHNAAQATVAIEFAAAQINAPLTRKTFFNVLPTTETGYGIMCASPTVLRPFAGATVTIDPPYTAPPGHVGQTRVAHPTVPFSRIPRGVPVPVPNRAPDQPPAAARASNNWAQTAGITIVGVAATAAVVYSAPAWVPIAGGVAAFGMLNR